MRLPITLAVNMAVPVRLFALATTWNAPAPFTVAVPLVSSVINWGDELDHHTLSVMSRDDPSLNVPVARNDAWALPPGAIVTVCMGGVTVMPVSPSIVGPFIVPPAPPAGPIPAPPPPPGALPPVPPSSALTPFF